ncbi:flagellar biosynthesis protein FlhF [Bacillus sp. T33-2]|uniref:flagellar biosynthesis protein FlhF n=1 Tax=Bacillus sp. T33-2 TaxID=2054168 RepID=UPI000C77D76E|nr:flagellar biosynthesis protein FlhF [Bacillus sp. T33-2]PLR97261.1 flagellar biosynthesis protein FlhF [Bacillus sp. T33-2]
MKIKKYSASSMSEAMKHIRAELGTEAVILNSRTIQSGGFLGFFRKSHIEVIAAVDPQSSAGMKQELKEKVPRLPSAKAVKETAQPVDAGTSLNPAQPPEWLKEISELKKLLTSVPHGSTSAVPYPGPVKMAAHLLESQEIDAIIREELLGVLMEKWYTTGADASSAEVITWLKDAVNERMSNFPSGGISFTRKFVNVVGPTGVGKTTTLAKLAADCVLKHKKKVAFITTDTYRIAAIDQLKTYAKILDIPLEVCYNLEDFKNAADRFIEYDVVLIDTAGRNFRNRKYVEDLKTVIDYDGEMETFLVLSLTSKQKDMEEIFRQFSLIHIDRFIFTKTDETSIYGSMLNMSEKFSTGIAYLTNGQDVPDDLIEAEPRVIANTLTGVFD